MVRKTFKKLTLPQVFSCVVCFSETDSTQQQALLWSTAILIGFLLIAFIWLWLAFKHPSE